MNPKSVQKAWESNNFSYDGSVLIFERNEPRRKDQDGLLPLATVHSIPRYPEMGADATRTDHIALISAARIMAAGREMLAALEQIQKVSKSEAFKAWEGAAALTYIRSGTSGYDGEPFDWDAVNKAIAKARNGVK